MRPLHHLPGVVLDELDDPVLGAVLQAHAVLVQLDEEQDGVVGGELGDELHPGGLQQLGQLVQAGQLEDLEVEQNWTVGQCPKERRIFFLMASLSQTG